MHLDGVGSSSVVSKGGLCLCDVSRLSCYFLHLEISVIVGVGRMAIAMPACADCAVQADALAEGLSSQVCCDDVPNLGTADSGADLSRAEHQLITFSRDER